MVKKNWIENLRHELNIEGVAIEIYDSNNNILLDIEEEFNKPFTKEYIISGYKTMIYIDSNIYKDRLESISNIVAHLVKEKLKKICLMFKLDDLNTFNFRIAETVPDAILVFDNNDM